ncbi:MAG: hypothetical protein P4M07_21325 [Xanthobacteraceae bacterium]|nr:hypothetical protein [Xanthobacteraceae bacterium]
MRLGRWAVIAAAYALLLNVTLSGTLLASISPLDADPLHQLCLNATVAVDGQADHDKAHLRVVPCQFCLSHNAAFIAPAAPALPASIRVGVASDPVVHTTFLVCGIVRDCQPRGPPSFV